MASIRIRWRLPAYVPIGPGPAAVPAAPPAGQPSVGLHGRARPLPGSRPPERPPLRPLQTTPPQKVMLPRSFPKLRVGCDSPPFPSNTPELFPTCVCQLFPWQSPFWGICKPTLAVSGRIPLSGSLCGRRPADSLLRTIPSRQISWILLCSGWIEFHLRRNRQTMRRGDVIHHLRESF